MKYTIFKSISSTLYLKYQTSTHVLEVLPNSALFLFFFARNDIKKLTISSILSGLSKQKRRKAKSCSSDSSKTSSAHTILGFTSEAVRFSERKVFQRKETARARDNFTARKSCRQSTESRDSRQAATRDAQTFGSTTSGATNWKIRSPRFADRLGRELEQRRPVKFLLIQCSAIAETYFRI